MKWLKKLFCSHLWKTHAKKEYQWSEDNMVEGTECWIQPVFNKQDISETVEILICEKCGKIEKITY